MPQRWDQGETPNPQPTPQIQPGVRGGGPVLQVIVVTGDHPAAAIGVRGGGPIRQMAVVTGMTPLWLFGADGGGPVLRVILVTGEHPIEANCGLWRWSHPPRGCGDGGPPHYG